MNKPTQTKLAPAPQTVSLAEAMLANMSELAALLGEELAMIEKQDVSAIKELMRRKNQLVMNYQANMKAVAAQPDLLKQIPVERRAKLKEAGIRLSAVTERNALKLKAAAQATEQLLQNVMCLVRKEVVVKNSYANPRTAHMALGTHSPTCPPVAFNRTA